MRHSPTNLRGPVAEVGRTMRRGLAQIIWFPSLLLRQSWTAEHRAPVEVDYRDRVSIAVWGVTLGLGASILFDLPTLQYSFWALGSPVTLSFTGTILFAIFLAVMAGAAAQSVVAVHPYFAGLSWNIYARTWTYWALPMAVAIISVLLIPLATTAVVQALALLSCAGFLALALVALYATVERGQMGFRRARLALDALTYGCALLLFLFVYQTRTRSLVSSTLIGVTALLLAIEILRTATPRSSTTLVYSAIVGVILGQVTWALNYWVLPGMTGGLLLLLIFYLLVGIAQQGLQGRLTQRVMLEFGLFAIVALLLIAFVGPGFQR
jgi:hypothetical protein